MISTPSDPAYRDDITGLRAVAVIPVCLFHAGLRWVPGGFAGVDVFFVLSGYLMARLIVRELAEERFTFVAFFERRLRRIVPALVVMLLSVLAIATVLLLPRGLLDLGRAMTASALASSNMLFAISSLNYFDATTQTNPLLHTWSLALEEQFYVVFPVGLAILWKADRRARLLLVAAAAGASLAAGIWGAANAPTLSFYALPTRAWELLLGALLPLASPPPASIFQASRHIARWRSLAGLGGLGLVLASFALLDLESAIPGLAALAPALGTGLLLWSGEAGLPATARLLSLAPLVAIGRISYSLYLWHWPMLIFVGRHRLLGDPTPWHSALALLLAALLAYVSWRLVEQPWHTRRDGLRTGPVIALSIASLGVCALAGVLVQRSQGWPGRFPGLAIYADSDGFDSTLTRQAPPAGCFVAEPQDWQGETCFLSRHGAEHALLWGDSFANHYAYGLFANAKSLDILQYTTPQCPPVIGYQAASRRQCAAFGKRIDAIITRYAITTVILAANWGRYLKRRKLSFGDIRRTVADLRARSLKVVLVGQSPEFAFDYPDEYLYTRYGSHPAESAFYGETVSDPNLNADLKSIAGEDGFFDPARELCRGTACLVRLNGHTLFADYGHYTEYGSDMMARRLLQRMGAQLQPRAHVPGAN